MATAFIIRASEERCSALPSAGREAQVIKQRRSSTFRVVSCIFPVKWLFKPALEHTMNAPSTPPSTPTASLPTSARPNGAAGNPHR